MNLVATTKLQRARRRIDVCKDMFDSIREIMVNCGLDERLNGHEFFKGREKVRNIAYVVFSADRGLCGGYNANIAKRAIAELRKFEHGRAEVKPVIIAVGSKAAAHIRRAGYEVYKQYPAPPEAGVYGYSHEICELVFQMFLSGEVDEVHTVYTQFNSVIVHVPRERRILPLPERVLDDIANNRKNQSGKLVFDPNIVDFLKAALPLFVESRINNAANHASACELAARMTSMDAADNNAQEVIGKLTLNYNRKRQGMITQEITEIVSGANAV